MVVSGYHWRVPKVTTTPLQLSDDSIFVICVVRAPIGPHSGWDYSQVSSWFFCCSSLSQVCSHPNGIHEYAVGNNLRTR